MRVRDFVLSGVVAGALLAQGGPARNQIAPYNPTYDQLKSALNLTEAQIAQLKQIQQDRQRATQAIYQQIADKQKQLTDLLNAPSPDALAIGNLTIELQNLRKQVPGAGVGTMHDQALAVLNESQKAALAPLQNALNLRPAVDQAMSLYLLIK